jgi:hypothetical protein
MEPGKPGHASTSASLRSGASSLKVFCNTACTPNIPPKSGALSSALVEATPRSARNRRSSPLKIRGIREFRGAGQKQIRSLSRARNQARGQQQQREDAFLRH